VADYEVIGVLPPAFTALPSYEDVTIVALSSIDPDAGTGRDRRNRRVFGRLRDGVTLADARAEMATLASGLSAAYPTTNIGWTVAVTPLVEHEVGPIGEALRSFFFAVGFVFLIACANIASLQLARALARRREFSIRQAIGDNRAGLVRSLLVESVVVGAMAVQNAMSYFKRGVLLITPGDREDIILAAASSICTESGPALAGIVLTGNLRPGEPVLKVIRELQFPVLLAKEDSYAVASKVHDVTIKTSPHDTEKISLIRDMIAEHVDVQKILKSL